MPYARKRFKPRRKARPSRARPRRKAPSRTWVQTTTPRRQGTLWPDAFKCKLRYSVIYANTGTPATYISIRGNGPFDPETAVGGGQPVGFDQFGAIYSSHYVRGCSIATRSVQAAGAPVTQVTLYPTTVGSMSAQDSAQPYSKSRIVAADTSGKAMVRGYITTNKVFGRDTTKETGFFGGTGVLPLTQWYWHLRIEALDGVSNLSSFSVLYVTYYVTFSNRAKLLDE